MKSLKSKTIIAAIILAIVGAAQALTEGSVFSSDVSGYILMGVAVLQGILRKVTTQPLSEK